MRIRLEEGRAYFTDKPGNTRGHRYVLTATGFVAIWSRQGVAGYDYFDAVDGLRWLGFKSGPLDPMHAWGELVPAVVVFRKWKEGGQVIALFPDERNVQVDKPWLCESYMHVGQHGAADYAGVVQASEPATEAEYASLRRELEGLGYRLKVLKRWTRRR